VRGEAIAERFPEAPPDRLAFAGRTPAWISDDTQMTLFTCEGLLRWRAAKAGGPEGFLLGAYQRWLTTQSQGGQAKARSNAGLLLAEPRLYARRAPGQTCESALTMSILRGERASVARPPNGSKGCGAIMRSAPFGLVAATADEAFAMARDAGALTHGHPSGHLSAGHLAALVFALVRGSTFEGALAAADEALAREPENDEVVAAVRAVRECARAGVTRASIEALGGGWVGEESLGIAIACALAGDPSVRATLWRSVLHDGDSDSTGSITGNLLGAMRGTLGDAEPWLADLELGDLVERMANDLHRSLRGEALSAEDYPPIEGVMRLGN
jgi:ADP-ribosylglycohydrolase